jgi:hypothetical protein
VCYLPPEGPVGTLCDRDRAAGLLVIVLLVVVPRSGDPAHRTGSKVLLRGRSFEFEPQ